MKTQILSIVASAALLCGATAGAAAKTTQNEDVKAVQAAAGAGEKKICKRLEASGTRLVGRTCLTKQEWKKLESLD